MSRRNLPARAAKNPATPTRGTRTQPQRDSAQNAERFYSEDTDLSDFEGASNSIIPAKRQLSGSAQSQTPKAQKSSLQSRAGRSRATPRRQKITAEVGRPRKANDLKSQSTVNVTHGPRWPPGLPYLVLLSIFQYAAYPLHDDYFNSLPSVRWLVQVALLRREFAEPALSALYYAPPLLPPDRGQKLLQMLQSQPESSYIDYQNKIRYLDIEIMSTLIKKYGGNEPLKLHEVIEVAPQLRGVGLHVLDDNPVLKGTAMISSRLDNNHASDIYSAKVYEALERCPLQHWKWNYYVKPYWEFPWRALTVLHERPGFQGLKSLEIGRFGGFSLSKSYWSACENHLCTALGALPVLEALTFTGCDLLDREGIFDKIKDLKQLALVDCRNVDSSFLIHVLSEHGQILRNLTLKHNEALDLSFSPQLADLCPLLESIDLDLAIYSSLLTSSAELQFAALLPDRLFPTWPTTLQRICMVQLRRWGADSAGAFFESLENAAPNLPNLHTLIIKASLEVDWKDRIAFRNKWVSTLTKTFLKDSGPSPKSRSAKAAEQQASHNAQAKREGARSKLRRRSRSRSHGDREFEPTMHRQGRCSVVDVRIDNLRPMGYQYDESNFMDEEKSGDEDWDGDDAADDGYAW